MTRDQIQRQLQDVFSRHLGASSATTDRLVPSGLLSGKLYEAYVLSRVVEQLASREGCSLILRGGTKIKLKTSGGPINRQYPRIEVYRSGNCIAELWTDVEFLSLSYCSGGKGRPLTAGDFHELDIVITRAGVSGRPEYQDIWLGVECKNTGYQKGLLREILGIRRELSLLVEPQPTNFRSWPRTMVPANPSSCLLAYSTDPNVTEYAAPGTIFGIDFVYEPM